MSINPAIPVGICLISCALLPTFKMDKLLMCVSKGCLQSKCPCLQHLAGLEWGRPDLPRWQPLALIASPHWPPPPPPPQLGISLDISLSGQGHPAPLRARPAPRCSADRPGPPQSLSARPRHQPRHRSEDIKRSPRSTVGCQRQGRREAVNRS